MNYQMLLAFFIGMTILAATPGPGVFASMAKAMSSGFRSALILIGGLAVGDSVFLILALIGMSTISRLMGEMFFIIKIAGGMYLIYLGLKLFSKKKSVQAEICDKNTTGFKTFVSGFLVTMSNPKPILFYSSVVPTIVDIEHITGLEVLVLSAILMTVSFLVVGSYSYIASLTRKLAVHGSMKKKLDTVAGTTMITAGSLILLRKG
ncbi:LysE family translocator [candidate division KSB1 bacterium]|nr:LysE family translocator [candidate division KSB1 bacterium]